MRLGKERLKYTLADLKGYGDLKAVSSILTYSNNFLVFFFSLWGGEWVRAWCGVFVYHQIEPRRITN